MTEGINLNQSNVAFYMYSIKKGGGKPLARQMKTWPKMLHHTRGSYEDQVALIRSDSCLWVIWGSVACKSPSCCYYNRWSTPGTAEERSTAPWASKGSMDTQRYLHTVRQTSWHCQPESVDVRSTPSCAEGRTLCDDNGPKNRTKRKCLNLGPFFHHLLFHSYGALELFSFVNSFSPPTTLPLQSSLSPLCHFNRRIFTFRANPKGGSASETRVQSITCFHWCSFRNYKCFLINPPNK